MRRLLRTFAAATVVALVVPLGGLVSTTATAGDSASSRLASQRQIALATPGDFTGYGFDQCLAPTQSAMDTWWKKSPFSAVGIYISGDSRACRSQPNLSPTWVATQVARGWRLLPIALGPQASCQPRFPRYADDFKISPKPTGGYALAAAQGSVEADNNAADATAYGIGAGSTIWYDLEGFNLGDTHCRESALVFVSSWVTRIKAHGYVAGFYSSASSGIKMLDDTRTQRPASSPCPTASGSHVGTARPTRRRPTSPRTVASGRSDEAVPRRAQRDVGRRHDQHRQQLHRPRRRLQRRTRGALPRHPTRLLEVTPPSPPPLPGPRGSRPSSAC